MSSDPSTRKVREGYKVTEVGVIPEEWEMKTLGEITSIYRGASPRPIKDPIWFANFSKVGWIRISDVTKSRKYLRKTSQYLSEKGVSKSRIVQRGKLIMSICGTIGKPIIIETPSCIHDGFIVFEDVHPNSILAEYLYYWVFCNEKHFQNQGQKGTQANINTDIVKATKLPLPPLPEQEKIAEVLSTVDEHIEETESLIEKTTTLKRGMMQKLLTQGIGHTEFKETEIGQIPVEWRIVSLGSKVNVISGGTPKTDVPEYWNDGDIYWATPTDITSSGKYIYSTKRSISKLGMKDSAAFLIPAFSVLMTSRATIGACSINTVPMATNQGFKSLIPKKELYNEFLYYLMLKKTKDLLRLAGGSTFVEISKVAVESLILQFPPLPEQHQIADILTTIDDRIDEHRSRLEKLNLLKTGLMQQLLTGKIRVQL